MKCLMNVIVWCDFVLGILMQMISPQTDQMALITVTWDHAVNSKAKLQNALASDSKIIEADVVTGHLIDEPDVEGLSTERIPIMGHPPAITSDLSLQELLHEWSKSSKLLKLDFKSTEAFMLAVPIMENLFEGLPPNRLPWLNADILPGPGPGGSPGMDADTLLGVSIKSFPESLLSLGWTTKHNDYGKYTEDNVNDMADVLFKNKYMKPVTYAVRASFAVNSVAELQYLLETSPSGSTLTVWCSDPRDVIDHAQLARLVNAVGEDRVYLDLPDDASKTFFDVYSANGGGGRVRSSVVASVSAATLLALKNAHFL